MCFNSFFNNTVARNSAPVEVGNLSRYLRGFKNIQPVVISSIKSSRLHPTVSLPGWQFFLRAANEFFDDLPYLWVFSLLIENRLQPKFHGKFPAMEGWWRFIAFGDSHNQKVCQLCNMSSRSSSTFWDSKKITPAPLPHHDGSPRSPPKFPRSPPKSLQPRNNEHWEIRGGHVSKVIFFDPLGDIMETSRLRCETIPTWRIHVAYHPASVKNQQLQGLHLTLSRSHLPNTVEYNGHAQNDYDRMFNQATFLSFRSANTAWYQVSSFLPVAWSS